MKNVTVTITSGTIFKVVLIGLLFVLLYFLRDFVLVLLTAVVLASSIEPATRWFGKYHIPRVFAVLGIYVSLLAALFGILYLFLPPLLNEASNALSILPQYLDSIGGTDYNFFGGQPLVGEISKGFSLKDTMAEFTSSLSILSGNVFQTISAVFGGLISFVLIIVISFYLAVQERGIENFLRLITPTSHEKYIIGLWDRAQIKIGRWMQGQLLLGLIVGILVYLGLTILGVKYALLLAVLAAVFELIPLFGPMLSAVPAVALGFMDSVTLGLMVVGLYVVVQQFENHLIYPLVVRKVVGVSPILVIIALIVGAKLAGFLGVLLAVPVAAAIMEFADDVHRNKVTQLAKEEGHSS